MVNLSSPLTVSLANTCFCWCRRQEIVFIGAGMSEDAITKQLDTALLTPAELEKYVQNYKHIPDPPHPELMQSSTA